MPLRPVSNPPNPWLSSEIEYLHEEDGGERPLAQLEVFEDHTRKIIASNDSPDIGFDYSINPYRGCSHACAYCLVGDTRILAGDGGTRALRDLRVGDVVIGTERRGRYRRYVRTRVLAHWQTVKPAHRVTLADGTELVASGDHRFLTARGWRFVTGESEGRARRPHLGPGDKLVGYGAVQAALSDSDEYRRGYLSGLIRGEALLAVYRHGRAGRIQLRLALSDAEALQRARAYLGAHEAGADLERVESLLEWPRDPSPDRDRGLLAGLFDAAGECRHGSLRIAASDEKVAAETLRALERHGFDARVDPPRRRGLAARVRLVGGLPARMRFLALAQPAIARKHDIAGAALKSDAPLQVRSVEALGVTLPMFDITTGTGDFIANGVVSHNCYARPGHEYLSFGAGTDFDRKIVIKPRAPALLREAFEARSWKGDLLVFSGVTDCYQPLESTYRLTRGCLEVCAEYKNPVGIITKAPLIERDIDVLTKLAAVADLGITISIPIWDRDKARAIEPYVATPERRMKTIARLAQAGLDVGVNVAPMIPGLNDEDIATVLTAAAEAGAKFAGFVFLRLPGPVAQVFDERVREALPLRAERILSRVREARGGKLYDSRWGKRQQGEGAYAEQARALFDMTCRRLGLNTIERRRKGDTFARPPRAGEQLSLI